MEIASLCDLLRCWYLRNRFSFSLHRKVVTGLAMTCPLLLLSVIKVADVTSCQGRSRDAIVIKIATFGLQFARSYFTAAVTKVNCQLDYYGLQNNPYYFGSTSLMKLSVQPARFNRKSVIQNGSKRFNTVAI